MANLAAGPSVVPAPHPNPEATVGFRLRAMLPIEVTLRSGACYRLVYRRNNVRERAGTTLELTERGSDRVVWEREYGPMDESMAPWTRGITVPAGSVAAEVFSTLASRGMAERFSDAALG